MSVRRVVVGAIIGVVLSSLLCVGAACAATPGQTQARRKASDYLSFQAFSRTGLIKQLKFDGFTTSQATYGADANRVNWNVQAVKKAKDYLGFQAFSRTGLINQLEFDGFSPAQATYGVKRAGL